MELRMMYIMICLSTLIIGLSHFVTMATSADVHYSVPEQSKHGLQIGNIPDSIDLINLVSQTSLPFMKYSFLSIDSNLRKYFALNEKTGDLTLSATETLDREVVCQFDLTCNLDLQIAIQSTHTQFFRKVLVSINVIDINDHSPEFKENFTTLTISESVQVPSSFPLPSAVDKDTGANNSLQGYEIFPSDGPFELSYSKANSNLMLRVIKDLDHEIRDLYSVRIVARDGGNPPREGVLNADIIVEDINDNAPKFTQENYSKVVDETVNRGSLLLSLKATDSDFGRNGEVRYRLSPQQPANILSMFSIDDISGELRLVGDFQTADVEVYKIDVEASDMAEQPFTTKTTVTITVEDTINSRPKLLISYLSQNNFSSISEYANLGVAVAHLLVRDTDRGPNGIVQCNLTTGGYFELQNYDVKEYKIIVARPLDRELIRVHNVTVQCFDSGLPPLKTSETFQVKVTDENDNAPIFRDRISNVTIRENNDIGREILVVTASDLDDPATGNGRITYSLQDVNSGEFLINPDTGVIKVMTSFDYELKRQINFTVLAEDNGIPRRSAKSSIKVNIQDENDQVPYFAQSRFTVAVSEYANRWDLIGEITAFDFEQGRNGQFEISLVSGSGRTRKNLNSAIYYSSGFKGNSLGDFEKIEDEKIPFEVHSNGSLLLVGSLDHEAVVCYEFEVRVTDKGEPPLSDTATVVIDVTDENDNAPIIVHPNISEVIYSTGIGSEAPYTLFSFQVVDRDSDRNSMLVYIVTARNDSGRFEIDNDGEVRRTRDLDSKDAGTYKLSIMVRDSGTPPLSDVRTFLIQVSGGNGTTGRSGFLSDQYVVIALTLVCVTILLSVTIILVIVVMRRLDRRRKSTGNGNARCPMHIHNSRVVTSFVDPIKMDSFRHDSLDSDYRDDDYGTMNGKSMNDSHFGFSLSSGSINKNVTADSGYQSSQVSNFNLPIPATADDDIALEGLQLHHVLLQSYQDSQVLALVPEDGASDSSGETITSDSGRGGSDEDISNTNGVSGSSMDGSRNAHNGSFQSCTSTFGHGANLKSSVKDPIRTSTRKHVTFKESERLRNSALMNAGTAEKSASNGSTETPDVCNSLVTFAGPLQKHVSNIFSNGTCSKSQQNLLTELNIPVSNDNSNAQIDIVNYNAFVGHCHPQNSTILMSSSFSYEEDPNKDSPKLLTFAAVPSTHQQSHQKLNNSKLFIYKAEDSVPSPMPKESPTEWRNKPRSTSKDSHDSQSHQIYLKMNSPRDLLKSQQQQQQQQQQNHNRIQSPQNNSRCESPSTFVRSSPKNSDAKQATDKENCYAIETNRGLFNVNCSKHNNPSTNLYNPCNNPHYTPSLPSLSAESPAPLLPPRETKFFIDKPLVINSSLNTDRIKCSRNQDLNRMASPDRPTGPSYWNNDSVTTTDDFDDQRSTTTSGSYTVDTDDDYLALEFKSKDVVV